MPGLYQAGLKKRVAIHVSDSVTEWVMGEACLHSNLCTDYATETGVWEPNSL